MQYGHFFIAMLGMSPYDVQICCCISTYMYIVINVSWSFALVIKYAAYDSVSVRTNCVS